MVNFKSEIAEALFDSSVKVSRDALIWAMSNLPDDKNHGSHAKSIKRTYNHDTENIWEAVGINREELDKLGVIMVDKLKIITEPNATVSKVVEAVIDATVEHPNLIFILAVKTVQDALESARSESQIKDMMKIMKMFDKFKRDNNDES